MCQARTLLGHELLALEKHDKAVGLGADWESGRKAGYEHSKNLFRVEAVQQYRSALNVDVRQYGAWWGLGKVCQFQASYSRLCETLAVSKAIRLGQEDLVQAKYNFLRAVSCPRLQDSRQRTVLFSICFVLATELAIHFEPAFAQIACQSQVEINGSNQVLRTSLGMVLQASCGRSPCGHGYLT